MSTTTPTLINSLKSKLLIHPKLLQPPQLLFLFVWQY